MLSEDTQAVDIAPCSVNGSSHAYPTSAPEPAPEDATEVNEAFAPPSPWLEGLWMTGKQ